MDLAKSEFCVLFSQKHGEPVPRYQTRNSNADGKIIILAKRGKDQTTKSAHFLIRYAINMNS